MSKDDLINKYNNMPLYLLEFMHTDTKNETLIMALTMLGKYVLVKQLYDKYPTLVRTLRYNSIQNKLQVFYSAILFYFKLLETRLPDLNMSFAYPTYIDIIEKELEYMDSPVLRNELTSPIYQIRPIYTIFKSYINRYKLYDEFPIIREGMIKFGFMEAVPIAVPKPASASNSSGGSPKKTRRRRRRGRGKTAKQPNNSSK